ncbi:MAG: hypothetical protein U1E77_05880 [Inhella sp.]
MNESQRPEQPSVEPQPIRSRRRFLGAGVVVPPTLLTLASQPALGVTCFTPSRSLSRNTSVSQQGKNGECTNAESPGNYGQHHTTKTDAAYHWPDKNTITPPLTLWSPDTPFHSVFSGSTFGTKKLWEVAAGLSADTSKVGKHLVGAYLNIKGGNGAVIPAHILDVDGVKRIWNEWDTKGYYEPAAGVRWYADYTMVGSKITVAAPNGGIKGYLLSNGIVK